MKPRRPDRPTSRRPDRSARFLFARIERVILSGEAKDLGSGIAQTVPSPRFFVSGESERSAGVSPVHSHATVPSGCLNQPGSPYSVAESPSRTFTTENMPPISMAPNWPQPVIIGRVLSGSGISISPISAMPLSPIAMNSGCTLRMVFVTRDMSAPIKVGTSWPMAFIV